MVSGWRLVLVGVQSWSWRISGFWFLVSGLSRKERKERKDSRSVLATKDTKNTKMIWGAGNVANVERRRTIMTLINCLSLRDHVLTENMV